jgi:Ni,Fe-hydrogenase III large subunit
VIGGLVLSDWRDLPDPAADNFARADVDADRWTALATACAAGRLSLLSVWSDPPHMRMALYEAGTGRRAIVRLATSDGAYPSVGRHHAPAVRLERAARDLHGVTPIGLPDARAWLDHGVWPDRSRAERGYAFLPAEGDGLHQIPVGPVHAGIIEPGHFRFTANGEAVVRLEERLGYVHRGVEALAVGADVASAGRLIGRLSGDSTVAYAFAYARAVEAALDVEPPPRAVRLRGVMAELERMAHHVNDFGAICNDASVVAIQARCTMLREDILATVDAVFGHRLMMDLVVPGGVARDLPAGGPTALRALLERVRNGLAGATSAYDDAPSLQDRTVTTGIVRAELVERFAAGGYVGRASGRAFDARRATPYPPYDAVRFEVPTRTSGDVDARAMVRIAEIVESRSIILQLLDGLAPGRIAATLPDGTSGDGAALVEAFRGDAFVAVRLERGEVARLHARDASWFQWPLLEAAVEGNIVADFPLCNKSFNCSYAGHDG